MTIPKAQFNSVSMGSTAAAVKSKASPKQWSQLVAGAKKRGVTLDSYLSGLPGPLQQRTRSSLVAQAKKTVGTTYAPAYTELDSQATQTKALDAKRAADNLHYRDWLTQQQQALTTAQGTLNSAVQQRQQQVQDQVNAQYAAGAQQIAQAGNARAGNTTIGDQNAQAAQNATQPQQTYTSNLVSNERQHTLDTQKLGNDQRANAAANSLAMMAASDAKRTSDTWSKLSDLGDQKTKDKLAQAADTAKEVSRLLDQEITKANSVSQNSIAQAGLGLKQQTLALSASKAVETARHNSATEGITMTRVQNSQMNADRNYNLAAAKYGTQVARDLYQRQHGIGPYKLNAKTGTKPALSQVSQNRLFSDVEHAKSVATFLHSKGFSPADIASRLGTGGTFTDSTTHQKVTWGPMSGEIAHAGVDLAGPVGALSQASVKALHSLGLVIGKRYNISYPSPPPKGGSSQLLPGFDPLHP